MANKSIRISKQSIQSSHQNDEIYSDISMSCGHRCHDGSDGKTLPDDRVVDRSINVRAVQNSLDNIFSWIQGERIINPEFGTKLYFMLYEGITSYNEEMIVAEIKSSVEKWEPRVVITEVLNISQTADTEDNTIVLDIKYYIKGLSATVYVKQYVFNRNGE